MQRLISLLIGTLLAGFGAAASAEEIAVGNYGVSASGCLRRRARQRLFQDGSTSRPHLVMVAARHCATCWPAVAYLWRSNGVVVSAILAGADQDHQRQRATVANSSGQ
jgi:hypothetical protein